MTSIATTASTPTALSRPAWTWSTDRSPVERADVDVDAVVGDCLAADPKDVDRGNRQRAAVVPGVGDAEFLDHRVVDGPVAQHVVAKAGDGVEERPHHLLDGVPSVDRFGVAEPEDHVVCEALGPPHDVQLVGGTEHGTSEFTVRHASSPRWQQN